jgi:hypothetical protein
VAEENGAVSGFELELTVLPGLPLGPLAQTLKVMTNLKDHNALEIPLYGTVVSDVSLVGGGVNSDKLLVNMGTLDQGQPHHKTVFVLVKGPYREETKVQIAGTQPEEQFAAELGEPIRDNPKLVRYPLTITIPESAVPVVRNGDEAYARIKFDITHPQVKEMTVRVRYVVK